MDGLTESAHLLQRSRVFPFRRSKLVLNHSQFLVTFGQLMYARSAMI